MTCIERSPDEIQSLADEIRMNGYVLLDDMIPAETVDAMRAAFDPLLRAKRESQPPNRGANRFQMHLPFEPPFADPILYANPTVLAILENLFGKDSILTYFASDTPFPGSDYQRVHLDCRLPFPEGPFGVPVYSVVLNTPLVDFTEENGPLEIWPNGTHMIAEPRDLERMAAKMNSVRLLPKTGSILLRDARMWHRGTPSHGERSRPNIALVYSRGWFRFENHSVRMKIPRATYDGFPDSLRPMFRYCAILEQDGTISDVE
ncbi:MAG TPA: phytanoyl-CoA dioxygenase family protein [Chthonomonadaceae bacterium]|nr:phytanoyl-CoA dioxygenase family protein [Chthonomonadaceae bacterium]